MLQTRRITTELTIGIKHTSSFPRRRVMLELLLHSIRSLYGGAIRVLVADDGGAAAIDQTLGAELIPLSNHAGLGRGRNALVEATRTPFLAILDDDVKFHNATRLDTLLSILDSQPQAALAAGCYVDSRFPHNEDCFNLRFDVTKGGAIVRAQPMHAVAGCHVTHAAHNFFVARTATLRRFGWDPRQKMMEHETFFYQLFVNSQTVLACKGISVVHNTTRDIQYRERSFRLQEKRFMQYLCKNFPEVARFETPYLLWRCDTRTYCTPAWHAQFPYDGRQCMPMRWATDDDHSTVTRPILSLHADRDRPADRRPHVPLLALIFTEPRNTARRAWQRATWLSFQWHTGYLEHELVPWKHLFIMAKQPVSNLASDAKAVPAPRQDVLVGDTVTLSGCIEGYEKLVFKTLEALRWAVTYVNTDVILKVDDDSIVHIGRLWTWLHHELPKEGAHSPRIENLYAGRVFKHSQVVRQNFTRDDLWHPEWFPNGFQKWAVDEGAFSEPAYPPYCGGGGYILGRAAATKVLHQYDTAFAPKGRVIPVEDAFIGILARDSGVSPKEVLTFQEPARGSHQTRELFIDQVLVHRVVEPMKAFRWLMLSVNCHAGARVCAQVKNRTRGLASQAPLQTSTDAMVAETWEDLRPAHDRDWVSGSIPHAAVDAVTGRSPTAQMGLRQAKRGASNKLRNRKKKSRRRVQMAATYRDRAIRDEA